MRTDAAPTDVERVLSVIEAMGLTAHPVAGNSRTAIGITGNIGTIDPARFENLPGVAEAIRITKPVHLTAGDGVKARSVVRIGSAEVGRGLSLIAGPCAVESRDQVFRTAEAVAATGTTLFRGGAFKPRTSPYAFQGLGEEGLQILDEARRQFGLSVVTEAMDERGVDLVEKYADCIQIGARNMQNYVLLRHVGRSRMPVLLKRGLSATLDELLLAAEYIMAEGNENVILCERGVRTFVDHARNTLDLSIIPALHRLSHLPVIVDPSHGTGHSYMVGPMAMAAAAAGADGLMIEVHPWPEEALCDGAQALTPGQYADLADQLKRVHQAIAARETAVAS
jgi:3-deoxy-7-phosphoheptulonate synthase